MTEPEEDDVRDQAMIDRDLLEAVFWDMRKQIIIDDSNNVVPVDKIRCVHISHEGGALKLELRTDDGQLYSITCGDQEELRSRLHDLAAAMGAKVDYTKKLDQIIKLLERLPRLASN